MSEWWSYRPSDFLLFSARTYQRLFELYNGELWPAQLLAVGLGIGLAGLLWRGHPLAARAACLLLAGAWLWVAWGFHWQRYATINWAATWFAAGFALEGLLWFGLAAGPVRVRELHGPRGGVGVGLRLQARAGVDEGAGARAEAEAEAEAEAGAEFRPGETSTAGMSAGASTAAGAGASTASNAVANVAADAAASAGGGAAASAGGGAGEGAGARRRAQIGLGLLLFALLLQPCIGPLFGRPWRQVELFALTPDPSAVGTLGLLLLLRPAADPGTRAARGWIGWLWPIPVLWCALSGLAQWTMHRADAWLLPAAALLALATAVWTGGPWRARGEAG